MCDFPDDPEQVPKLLVGRVLTVERVRQLTRRQSCQVDVAGLILEGRRKRVAVEGWNDAGTPIKK
jgi:hypothetical protein